MSVPAQGWQKKDCYKQFFCDLLTIIDLNFEKKSRRMCETSNTQKRSTLMWLSQTIHSLFPPQSWWGYGHFLKNSKRGHKWHFPEKGGTCQMGVHRIKKGVHKIYWTTFFLKFPFLRQKLPFLRQMLIFVKKILNI